MTRHVVWDWNGTLLADLDATMLGANAALARLGIEPISRETWRRTVTRPSRITYEAHAGRSLTENEWSLVVKVFLETYHEVLPQIGLAVDANAALAQFASWGWSQSIVSLYQHEGLLQLVADYGLSNYFADIQGSDGTGGSLNESWFNSPKANLLADQLNRLAVPPSQVVLIGDLVDDAVAANSVGAHPVLVSVGDTCREQLVSSGWPVADSLLEATALAAATLQAVETSGVDMVESETNEDH
jgi:phosphoglycolate phosphatase-like HAD superfamily hydrolase